MHETIIVGDIKILVSSPQAWQELMNALREAKQRAGSMVADGHGGEESMKQYEKPRTLADIVFDLEAAVVEEDKTHLTKVEADDTWNAALLERTKVRKELTNTLVTDGHIDVENAALRSQVFKAAGVAEPIPAREPDDIPF